MGEKNVPPKSVREPQALSSEYHKARKQLMLWAGILFIWELVGIDLEKAKETGGNAGALITALKSPQAIPWVLFVLVGYFAFKLGIEWKQCEARRKELLASRIDVGSAWVVAFFACVLYVYQTVSRIQVADVVQSSNGPQSFAVGLMLVVIPSMMLLFFKQPRQPPKNFYIVGVVLHLLVIVMMLGMAGQGLISWRYFIVGMVCSALFVWIVSRLRVLRLPPI